MASRNRRRRSHLRMVALVDVMSPTMQQQQRDAALEHRCGYCDAEQGDRCQNRTGDVLKHLPAHLERLRLAGVAPASTVGSSSPFTAPLTPAEVATESTASEWRWNDGVPMPSEPLDDDDSGEWYR